MPKYTVTDPTTGKKVTLTGDSPPTEQELEDIFASVAQAPAQRSPQDLQAAAATGDPQAEQEWEERQQAAGLSAAPVSLDEGFRKNAVAAAGSTLGDTFNGLMQYAAEGGPQGAAITGLANKMGIPLPSNPVQGWVDKRIAEKRALDAPLMELPGGTTGAVLGNISQMIGPGLGAKLAGASKTIAANAPQLSEGLLGISRALAPTSYKGNAMLGAGYGSAMPVQEDESRAANAALGSLFGLGGRALGDVARAPFVAGSAIKDAVGTAGADKKFAQFLFDTGIPEQLTVRQAPLAGQVLTSAQATGDPVIAALTRARESADPLFGRNLNDMLKNNQQVVNTTLGNYAPGQDAIDLATANRSAIAKPLYEAARKQSVDTSKLLDQVNRAVKKLEGNPAAQQNMQEVANLLTKRTLKDGTPIAENRGFVLDNVRTALGDMIAGRGTSSTGAQRLTDINVIPIKKRLEATFGKQVPEFAQAQRTYAENSADVNQKQVLQDIAGPMGKLFRNDNVTLGSINSVLNTGSQIVKRVTGQKRKALSDVLAPEQNQSLFDARKYLQMAEEARTVGKSGGSPTAQNLNFGSLLEDGTKKAVLKRLPIVGAILEGVEGVTKKRYESAINDALLDPKRLQQVLDSLPPAQRAKGYKAFGLTLKPSASIGVALRENQN